MQRNVQSFSACHIRFVLFLCVILSVFGSALPHDGLPGIGAVEYAGMTFVAGHDFNNLPHMDFTRSLPLHRNRIVNAATSDVINVFVRRLTEGKVYVDDFGLILR